MTIAVTKVWSLRDIGMHEGEDLFPDEPSRKDTFQRFRPNDIAVEYFKRVDEVRDVGSCALESIDSEYRSVITISTPIFRATL